MKNLFDYLEAGEPLEQFLLDFPAVDRAKAIAALEPRTLVKGGE